MSQSIFEIKHLYTAYAQKPVLDIHALEISQGEIVGLVGANGSGKSTLLRHLSFLENAKSGTLTYRSFSASLIPLDVKREISILLPEPYLLKRSVRENLLFGLRIRNDTFEVEKRLKEALELVGLLPKKFMHRLWHELSSGETQRVALASRLVLRPKTLLLDEPTNSLDFSGIPQFTDAILHANLEWGTTVVIASHDLLWLSSLATRKVGLHFGRLMEFSTTNLIVGKWRECEDALVFDFGDDQQMALPKTWRIGEKRGIAINPREIAILPPILERMEEQRIYLKGIVKELSHLEKSNEISIKIAIGHHTLESIQAFETFQKMLFYPSSKIAISFLKTSIKMPSKEE